jgi:hypothetical protein
MAEVSRDEAPGHHGVPVRRVRRGVCHAEAAQEACRHHAWQRGTQVQRDMTVLLHNGGFGNNCTPKRCLHNQMHYKTTFSHTGYMKSLEFYENYITLVCLEITNFLTILYYFRNNKLFDNIILFQNHAWLITQSG